MTQMILHLALQELFLIHLTYQIMTKTPLYVNPDFVEKINVESLIIPNDLDIIYVEMFEKILC